MTRTEEFEIVQEWLDTHRTWDFLFKPIPLALVRRSMPMPALFANTVVGIQPMAVPTGLGFAMRSIYGIFKDFPHPHEIPEDLINAISDGKLERFSMLCMFTQSIVFIEKIFIEHINNYIKSTPYTYTEANMNTYLDIFVECVAIHKLELIKQVSEM